MSSASRVHCVVAYALPERQFSWSVDVPSGATIDDALSEARRQSAGADVPWNSADVGIFGERKPRTARVEEGDRIEIYRPLANDPRERRRQRTRHRAGSG